MRKSSKRWGGSVEHTIKIGEGNREAVGFGRDTFSYERIKQKHQ